MGSGAMMLRQRSLALRLSVLVPRSPLDPAFPHLVLATLALWWAWAAHSDRAVQSRPLLMTRGQTLVEQL